MKKIVFIILSLFFITCCFSCDNDDDNNMDNYTKVKLEGTYKCASGEEQKDVVKKKYGTVVVYKENATDEQGLAYFKDKDNKIYNACSLPKAYQTDGLKIIFSGIVYYPNPAANTYNPLSGLEFEITELWINK